MRGLRGRAANRSTLDLGSIMPVNIAVVGCLDTKGEEVRYLKEVLETDGHRAHVVPVSSPSTRRRDVH